MRMKKHPQYFISKSPRRSTRVGMTIGIDLGEHITEENPLVKIVLSFECARKEDVFRFLGAIENAQKQDPNYATKVELAKQTGEQHSS